MTNENINDIHIGEAERITWVDFADTGNDAFEVDYIIGKHNDFWTFFEIFCVVECCGLNAFRFYPEDIAMAAKEIDKKVLKQDLSQLKIDIASSGKEIIISSRLNNLVEKTVFTKLLDHIIKNL